MKRNHRRKNRRPGYGEVRKDVICVEKEEGLFYDSWDRQDDTHAYQDVRRSEIPTHNGVVRNKNSEHLDKAMEGFRDRAELADRDIGASIGNNFSNGNRGMARAVKGAKKYVRSRRRFHENKATRDMMRDPDLLSDG
jgi:hypothetical protein